MSLSGALSCAVSQSPDICGTGIETVLYVVDGSCFFFLPRQDLQTQQMIHGEARSSKGEVTKAMIPSPTRIPTTCVRFHITDALEWPSLFLHGPLS